jgi:hypothetical protein
MHARKKDKDAGQGNKSGKPSELARQPKRKALA